MGDCTHKKVDIFMYNCDFEGVSRRKSEKKGKTVWPSSRPFSTWPHRKLANEISPRKAIGLQIFMARLTFNDRD